MKNEVVINNLCFRDSSEAGIVNKDTGYILKDINISIRKGEALSLLGPSGCGKTTLLRIIAGLEKHYSGEIFFRGADIAGVPPHQRNFGMMFQDFALFPHRNVFQNISFGLEMKKFSKKAIESRVKEMLELVNLEKQTKRDIRELSGGERQRVALARTLAPSPDLIMLDEPLGALDRRLRERLLSDLCLILDKTGITTIWVTHDHNEAFAVADIVCIMNRGEVKQIDSPENLYHNPANRTVADFLGFQNIMDVQDEINGRDGINGEVGKDCFVLIMPDSASAISKDEFVPEKSNMVAGIIRDVVFQGSSRKISINTLNNTYIEKDLKTSSVKISIPDQNLYFEISSHTSIPKVGEAIFLNINPNGIKVLS